MVALEELEKMAKKKSSALARNQTVMLCLSSMKPSYYSD
jgi:hypothetical protein